MYNYSITEFDIMKQIEQEALAELQEIQSDILSEQQRFKNLALNTVDLSLSNNYLKISEIMQRDLIEINRTIDNILNK